MNDALELPQVQCWLKVSYQLQMLKKNIWTAGSVGATRSGRGRFHGGEISRLDGFCSEASKTVCILASGGAAELLVLLLCSSKEHVAAFTLCHKKHRRRSEGSEKAMQGSVTTVSTTSSSSSSLNGSTKTLNSTLVTCTETGTFTQVLGEEEWGSFYYSFKVGNTELSCWHPSASRRNLAREQSPPIRYWNLVAFESAAGFPQLTPLFQ